MTTGIEPTLDALDAAVTAIIGRLQAVQRTRPIVSIVNQSSSVSDAEARVVTAALQTQVSRDLLRLAHPVPQGIEHKTLYGGVSPNRRKFCHAHVAR